MILLAPCCRRWRSSSAAVVYRRFSSTVPAPPYKILFCGTDSFAAKSLEALIQHRSQLCPELYVLTPPDVVQKWGAKRMRTSPVKILARQYELPHQDVPSGGMVNYTLPPAFETPSPSAILLTCSFGHMIPDALLQAFPHPYQRLNIHPSLLPQLRGAAPIQWAISRRLATSGISIQSLESRRFDSGRIFAQQEMPFPPPEAHNSTVYTELEGIMAQYAAKLFVQMLQNLPHHVERSWEQDPTAVSRAPKIKQTDCKIDFNTMTTDQIVANYNAFSYLYPLYCSLIPQKPGFPDLETSFHSLDAISDTEAQSACPMTWKEMRGCEPGWATYSPGLDAIIVKCTDTDQLLRVHTLQSKGKKLKPAKEWWTGYRDRASPHGLLCFT